MVQRYPTDLTEAEWTILAPLIPAAQPGGRPRTTDMREVVNAILYSLRSGCQWRMLPKDFPPVWSNYLNSPFCTQLRTRLPALLALPAIPSEPLQAST